MDSVIPSEKLRVHFTNNFHRIRNFLTKSNFKKMIEHIRKNPFTPFSIIVCVLFSIVIILKTSISTVRLQMYIIQTLIFFFMPIFMIDYDRFKNMKSKTTKSDVVVSCGIIVAIVLINLAGNFSAFGYRISSQFGFMDTIILLLALTILFFGRANLKPFFAPLGLVFSLAIIMVFVSTENATFNSLIGNHFVYFTTISTVTLLNILGYTATSGMDYITIHSNNSTLTVWIGVRCGGIDAVLIYSLLLSILLFSLNAPRWKCGILVICGVIGALFVNVFRVLILCLIGIYYSVGIVETAHSHFGDLLFVGYIALFWWFAFKYLLKEGETAKGENGKCG